MNSVLLLLAILGQSPPLTVTPNSALLTKPTVQSALELTVPQTRAIFVIHTTAVAALKRLARRHSKAPVPQVGTPDSALPALEKFGKGLPLDKQERLAQITLQAYGPRVLTASGVGKALGLSAAQVDKITGAQLDTAKPYEEKERLWAEAHSGPWRTVGGDLKVPAVTREISRMNAERDAKLTELLTKHLTPEQNDRLAKMLGKPVKLS